MSYKNLGELGITPIKCQNKATSECLKSVHYEINDLLYSWQFTYLSPRAADYIADRLDGYLSTLRGMKVEDGCIEKWKEIGRTVKNYTVMLRKYAQETTYDPGAEEAVLKRQVALYLKAKETATIDDLFEMAKRAKLFGELYKYGLNSFNNMRKELIERISKELEVKDWRDEVL